MPSIIYELYTNLAGWLLVKLVGQVAANSWNFEFRPRLTVAGHLTCASLWCPDCST